MKTLHLTLKKKWFYMILSGEKKEEYREIKHYWTGRLVVDPMITQFNFKQFDTITFKNGYSKNAREMVVESLWIWIGQGVRRWGAPKEDVFVLKLGKIISTKNI